MPRLNPRITLLPRLIRLTHGVPAPVLLALRPLLAGVLAAVPGWRKRVRRSMAAGLGAEGFTERHVRAYFSHVADLVIFSALVHRSSVHTSGLEKYWIIDPASREIFLAALAGGKGALMVCPHLINHEVMAGVSTSEVPITVLVRKAPEPEYEALKQRWYAALNVEVVYRPPKGEKMGALAEMTSALRTLRRNRVLAMTPDLVQRPGTGIPVTLFGRPVELPAGPFFLAVRTGAPFLPSFVTYEAGKYRLWSHPPLVVDPTLDRDAAVAAIAQEWTTLFEQYLREHPDMWQFWLDKRWARWLDEA